MYGFQEKCKNMVMRFQSPLVYFKSVFFVSLNQSHYIMGAPKHVEYGSQARPRVYRSKRINATFVEQPNKNNLREQESS